MANKHEQFERKNFFEQTGSWQSQVIQYIYTARLRPLLIDNIPVYSKYSDR